MSKKFVYCTDEKLANDLIKKMELVTTQTISNKKTWIFENNNKLTFSKEDMSKLDFTNKFFI
jgi:hypothetical protein